MPTPTVEPPTVMNSPRRTIYVTDEDIAAAIPSDSSHCMIAEAIRRQVPEASHIDVDLQGIRWTDKKKGVRYIFLTPTIGQASLLMFDQAVKPKPFRLHLRDAHITHVRTNKRRKDLSERARGVARRALEMAGGEPVATEIIRQAIAESGSTDITERSVKYHLSALRGKRPTAADRPTSTGPAGWRDASGTHGTAEGRRVVRHGGTGQPLAVLAHNPRKGRRRTFGARLAGVPTIDSGE